jgi:hypothetical protein
MKGKYMKINRNATKLRPVLITDERVFKQVQNLM